MKSFILLLLSFVLFIFPVTTFAAMGRQPDTEEILTFDSEITINQDTSLSIVEKIRYFTPELKHGIYRYIPEKYKKEGLIDTNKISDMSVTDSDGKSIPFEIIREKGNVTMKIGYPEFTFSGLQTYIISYKVQDAVTHQDGFDELYWDITGEGWQFPIQSSQVSINSPHAGIKEIICFTGRVGGYETDCQVSPGDKSWNVVSGESTSYGENFTVAVKLDENNSLFFPSTFQKVVKHVGNNLPLFLPILPALVMFIYWYRKGRDLRFDSPNVFDMDPSEPQRMRPVFESVNIPMVYEPLKSLTPGEAGAMLDERVDNQDVIAEIIDLARKKFLKIEKVEKTGFLQFGHDYLFTKLKAKYEFLPAQQSYLMENLFSTGSEVKLSELKGKFYIHMGKVKDMIHEELIRKNLFTSKPLTAISKGVTLAVLSGIICFYLSISAIGFLNAAWPVGLMFVGFLTSLIFSLKMPQRTAIGTNLTLHAKGLKETIRLGKWREEIKEKHLFVEEVLPFAIALGVIGKLAKDMAKLNIEPPKYISGGNGLNAIAWSGFMSDFSSTASSGLSYNPSSSSSGGSGFSGGSSGGGGGGGGGGSW